MFAVTAAEIVRDLAAMNPSRLSARGVIECPFCQAITVTGRLEAGQHDSSCVWRRATALVACACQQGAA